MNSSTSSASTVGSLLDSVDALWPTVHAEPWDTPGLQVGSRRAHVSRVLLAVDVTPDVVSEARAQNAEAILAHHPLLLRGPQYLDAEGDRGKLVHELVKANIACVAAHTNADIVEDGVSDVIAQALELTDVEPIEPGVIGGQGLGRVGGLSTPLTLRSLAERLESLLPATVTGIRVSGHPEAIVASVALCGGAGDSFLTHPRVISSDVYITSDLRHHPALDASIRSEIGCGPNLIDVSHWASESLWLEVAAKQLRVAQPNVEFVVSSVRTDPWTFVVN